MAAAVGLLVHLGGARAVVGQRAALGPWHHNLAADSGGLTATGAVQSWPRRVPGPAQR